MDRLRWEVLIRAVTYGILSSPMPPDEGDVRGGLHVAGASGALGGSPPEYLEAIVAALASTENLARVFGLPHADETVRAYLRAVEAGLRAQLGQK